MMILSLDNLATRYHMLPSQCMQEASTFDFHVMDVATRYQIRKQEIAEGKVPQKQVSQNELLKMAQYAKEKSGGKSKSN